MQPDPRSELDRILAWVHAQMDEDEMLAKAAIIPTHEGPGAYNPHPELATWRYVPGGEVEYVSTPEMQRHEYAETYRVTCDSEGILPAVDESVGPHIARHDPASALDRVPAHRAILADCVKVIGDRDLVGYGQPGWSRSDRDALAVSLAVQTIRNLAAAYAHRDGYDPSWGSA